MMSMACFFLAATIVLFVDGFEVKGIRLTSRIMLYLTGYIMRPAAATLWMVVVLYLVMKYQVKGLAVVSVLIVACWIAWIMAVAESITDETC
ncbi:hypothetical protein [Intestinimonas timonensis]|uniref:hypothetical protein n=1 Tax=Intestinimonas timonensis TaxID=1689270 RepID=UPI001030BB9F|nr:hypothetical protein [Intestinimonas timonensis]